MISKGLESSLNNFEAINLLQKAYLNKIFERTCKTNYKITSRSWFKWKKLENYECKKYRKIFKKYVKMDKKCKV